MKYIETAAIPCYEEIGFTTACSAALSYHQKSIVDEDCGYQCSAWGYDGDLGQRTFIRCFFVVNSKDFEEIYDGRHA
jgi:hypothetical protein